MTDSGCSHCGTKHGLRYYYEGASTNEDVYYCQGCYGLYVWNGETMLAITGEAYLDRDKSQDLAVKIH